MNNKGFTLVELIIVVAIIAVLALVFTPNVMNLVNKNNTDTYNDSIRSIENAAKMYVSDNRYNQDFIKDLNCSDTQSITTTTVTIQKLYDTGALSKMPVHSCRKQENFDETEEVTIIFDCNKKQYSYKFREIIDITNCTN